MNQLKPNHAVKCTAEERKIIEKIANLTGTKIPDFSEDHPFLFVLENGHLWSWKDNGNAGWATVISYNEFITRLLNVHIEFAEFHPSYIIKKEMGYTDGLLIIQEGIQVDPKKLKVVIDGDVIKFQKL